MSELFGRVASLAMVTVVFAGMALCGPCASPVCAQGSPTFQQQLWPNPMANLYDNHLQAESSRWLAIYLYDIMIDHAKVDPSQFTITSKDDPAYTAEKKVQPLRTSSRTRAIRVALRKTLLVKATVIFLELPSPMQRGCEYSVSVGELGAEIPALSPIPFDDHRQINDNIRINQLGYLSGQDKIAYLGQYLGSAGGLPFDADRFDILDADGKSVFQGKLARRNVRNDLVGQILFDINFTAFEPGSKVGPYYIFIPGVGLSYPFEVGPDALNPFFGSLMLGSYHQRCGAAVEAPYSRFVRPACHLDDAYIDQKVESLKFVQPANPPLYPTRYGRHQSAVHGHHDAGDYGKYTISGADYVFSILNAIEVFPDRFNSDSLGLPYSGNGIPDLLDEVKWEIDWLENMQDTDDGGVFGVIKPNTGGYENALPLVKAGRYFYPKDTVFTAAFAGALAHAASSPVMRKYYPADCKRYLAKAIKAWDFLEKNHRYVHYFHYGSLFDDWDDRCWAAASLYRATGEQVYHKAFLEQFDPSKKRWGWQPLTGTVGNAAYTYLFMNGRDRDAGMLERCRQVVHDACEKFIADSEAFPYRLSMPQDSIRHGAYGWLFPGEQFGYNLLMGYALKPDPRYLTCALNNLNYQMGANPSGYVLQTGLGWKRNIEVVDQESVNDDIIEPVPGIPLGIGSGGFYWLNKYGRTSGEGTYPGDWPLMNRWYDGFNVNTEFTTGPMSREMVVAAYFARPQAKHTRPTVKIRADRRIGSAPLEVKFSIQAVVPGGRVRQVFWDFDDESFSTDFSPVHRFTVPGREFTVAVTIVDDQGVIAFDTIRIGVRTRADRGPAAPFDTDTQTAALFHFDGDLSNAAQSAATMKPAESHNDQVPVFDSEANAWMEHAQGACLVLDGKSLWQIDLPAGKTASQGLTIEAMAYVKAFTGWGAKPDSMLMYVYQDKQTRFGLKQSTWDRSMAPELNTAEGPVITGTKIAERFALNQWCHIKLQYTPPESVKFFVDNVLLGEGKTKPFDAGQAGTMRLQFGQWRGMIDELRISYAQR